MADLILIVEDEPDLAATVEFNLQREGYETRIAPTGALALSIAQASPPSLVLLDLMLPDMAGAQVCRRLKALPGLADLPIIMVTAKAEESDRVVGFEVGADDYVVKPFSVRELLLRIRAILRRSQLATRDLAQDVQTFGCLTVDHAAHRIQIDGKDVVLTALEFKLLGILLSRAGRVQSREQLLRDVWGITADVNTRTVDTHIKRLRQKLGPASDYVVTLRGVGYRFKVRPNE
ncbi:MAG: two-component system phosphate regulon response regulator PhoB [Myxococcota bacterium]|jgi:two-component system phosphate regulon response regulator PhoB